MADKWPPSLKEFVKKTFAACTEANRPAVELELKERIKQAHDTNKLWQISWETVQLKSLSGAGKRKANPLTFTAKAASHVEEGDRLAKRQRRFEGTLGSGPSSSNGLTNGVHDMRLSPAPYVSEEYMKNIPDWDHHTIVGRSQKLEKKFLRLTDAPNPDDIRPLDVCKRALDHIKRKWKAEGNYGWVCDQFKSLRQDLTVQRIKNDLTVQVYEIHGRIALEKGDLGEFNQCASQLRVLYEQGLNGHRMEFLAYRILYLLFSRNRSELNGLLATITAEERTDPSVAHALDVRFAMSNSNYRRFFRLFVVAPKMGGYLMDQFTARERIKALSVMAKAYHQLPFPFIQQELAFDTDAECRAFLQLQGALSYKDGNPHVWDPKPSRDRLFQAANTTTKVDLRGQI